MNRGQRVNIHPIDDWDQLKESWPQMKADMELIEKISELGITNAVFAEELKMAEQKFDNVNRPKHYNREGGMESIDEMVFVFGVEAVKNFCLCNVWKYRYRAADKNGEEDLRKSDWYMNKYKELCEQNILPLF